MGSLYLSNNNNIFTPLDKKHSKILLQFNCTKLKGRETFISRYFLHSHFHVSLFTLLHFCSSLSLLLFSYTRPQRAKQRMRQYPAPRRPTTDNAGRDVYASVHNVHRFILYIPLSRRDNRIEGPLQIHWEKQLEKHERLDKKLYRKLKIIILGLNILALRGDAIFMINRFQFIILGGNVETSKMWCFYKMAAG